MRARLTVEYVLSLVFALSVLAQAATPTVLSSAVVPGLSGPEGPASQDIWLIILLLGTMIPAKGSRYSFLMAGAVSPLL